MAKTKNKDLLICYCSKKGKLNKKNLDKGTDCFCVPYNARAHLPGTRYKTVIMN